MDQRQSFDNSITEVIKKRISVRTYEPRPLSNDHKEKLISFINEMTGPFAPKVRFKLIDDLSIAENTEGKIGTYGVIMGAKSYILVAVEHGDGDLEQVGYMLEKTILFATYLGLGTCWLGGTFKRQGFENLVGLNEQEYMPVITPIGYPQDRKTLMDSLVRLAAGSNKRQKWEALFFDSEINTPLREEELAPQYAIALEMVRLGPSASNKQPWRIIKDKNQFHFYLMRNKGYNKTLGFDIQRIDMGIAMCHFEMTINEQGLVGQWERTNGIQVSKEWKELEYILTYKVTSSVTEP